MEKGDKPKPKPLKKDKKLKKQKKPKVKQQEQKQEQKQNVKIVIGETKPKRKYVRKPKAPTRPVANIVRGQTAVSYLGGEGDVNQVITGSLPSRQNIQQASSAPPRGGNPPPQPPILSQVQAPTTLDTELTATSELMYPVARTPAFEERKKKLVVKKKKPIVVQIGEGIGDFIKQNLLDQKPDFILQEPSRPIEKPKTPITIRPDAPPIPLKKKKGLYDVPIDIYVPPMKYEVEPEPEILTIKPTPSEKKPVRKQRAGKFDVPIEIVTKESKNLEQMEDVNRVEQTKPIEKEEIQGIVVEKKQEKVRKPRKKKVVLIIEDEGEVVSMEDQPLSKGDLSQSLRQMIVADTIDDMISTIETPVFSENQDFKTISQSVEVDNVPPNELDFGDEGLTQFNEEGFVPVGKTEGMEEAIIKKKGRPKKYEDPELAKQMKKEQTKESYQRLAEQRRLQKELMSAEERRTKQIDLNKEWQDFTALEQETDDIRYLVEKKAAERQQEEQNPYSYEKLNPNAPNIYVAQDYNPLGEYAGTIMYDIGKPKSTREAYNSDFISGDFNQQIGDLFSTNNFSILKPMVGSELGYSDENPVLTTALFSEDAVDSNLPFVGIEDIQFV